MSVRKALFLLNIGDYEKAVTDLTYPFIYGWADKIGADVHVIRERRFPDWPVTYEKLQIHELARKLGAEWNIYVDSDALIHPDMPDWTAYVPRDTVAHNGVDFASVRWHYDEYFRRDGRNIGACNWFTMASDWCLDLWRPLDDLSMEEALARIHPTLAEQRSGCIDEAHLIDDYVLSRNIARFGLKCKTIRAVMKALDFTTEKTFFYHLYARPASDFSDGTLSEDGKLVVKPGKITMLRQKLTEWGLEVRD